LIRLLHPTQRLTLPKEIDQRGSCKPHLTPALKLFKQATLLASDEVLIRAWREGEGAEAQRTRARGEVIYATPTLR
jgi:hypothetical protein